MHVIEYQPGHEKAAVRLMAVLQECERSLSNDRRPGEEMAAGHLQYLLDLCEKRSGKVFVAISEDEVIGFVTVFLEAEDEADLHLLPEYTQYGWISDLVVKESHRGSRAAALLLEQAERHCASTGVHHVKLAALKDNTRARRFYENSGYAEYEIVYRKRIQGHEQRNR